MYYTNNVNTSSRCRKAISKRPKLDGFMLQIAINKLNYNLRTKTKTEYKSKPKKDVFFPYYL